MTRPRGAIASPRHRLASAMPHRMIGVTPEQVLWKPTQLSMWLNNKDGDCTVAEEAFAKGTSGIFILDETVKIWATENNAMNGAVISDILAAMDKSGFHQSGQHYNDGPAASVDWTNAETLQNALAQGPLKLGVAATQLENAVPDPPTNGWYATGFTADANLDHCVSLAGFGSLAWLAIQLGVGVPEGANGAALTYAMFTWDSIGMIDWASLQAITGEAWLRNPCTIVR